MNAFDVPATPSTRVWTSPKGSVTVDAVAVHHEPVMEAVAYRVRSPDGVVVVSGDTRVCREVEEFSHNVDVLVHEVCRATALHDIIVGTRIEPIFEYHAAVELGVPERAGVRHLVLTHLIPAPSNSKEEQAFEDDVRQGGFKGKVTVGADLMTIPVSAPVKRAGP